MTSLLEAALAAVGVQVERSIVDLGLRGCVVGRPSDGRRALITMVGPDPASTALAEHSGWDLPLRSLEPIETASGPRTMLVEDLAVGVPSIGDGAPRPIGPNVPAYVPAVAERVATAHARGETVGWLHPALVLVDPDSLDLVAVAQRPLRASLAAPAGEGSAPLFGLAYLAPSDVRNRPATIADDVHRLAALVWRWRHGSAPFAGVSEAEHLHLLAGAASGPPIGGRGRAAAVDRPMDDLDGLLAKAIQPDARDRPTARDIVAALATAGAGWRTEADGT